MVKEWNDWKELPLDTLVLSLYKMQIFYIKEFNRCYRNMGNYHLKEEYQNKVYELNIPTSTITEDISEIIKNVKANIIETKSIIEKKPTYRLTQISMANYVLENKLIDFSPHLKVHIVRNAFSDRTHVVSRIGKKLQCTCSSKSIGECYHSMAVKFLTAEPQTSEKVYKLSVLKKKTSRGGRKAPRPGDIDMDKVIRADDSLEADNLILKTTDKRKYLDKPTSKSTSKIKKVSECQHLNDVINFNTELAEVEIVELPKLKVNPLTLSNDFKTLLPHEWISSFIINDVISYLIINYGKEKSILYIPSGIYKYLYTMKDNTNILQIFLDSFKQRFNFYNHKHKLKLRALDFRYNSFET